MNLSLFRSTSSILLSFLICIHPVFISSQELSSPTDSYIIQKGDTLWDLAFQFLGDPFQWPSIWHLNPYISNPDLIYPGNELKITGSVPYATTNDVNAKLVSQTAGTVDNTASTRDLLLATTDEFGDDNSLLSHLRHRNPLSSNFFASVPFLWTERDLSGNIYPGNATVDKPDERESYQRFDKIPITLQRGASYSVDDTVDIYQCMRFVRFRNSVSNLVKRVGKAKIVEVEGRKAFAVLYEMNDAIRGKERVARSIPFEPKTIDTLIDPDVAITAEVYTRAEETESPYPFQTLILDRGSSDGLMIGDILAVYHYQNPEKPGTLEVVGYIAYTTPMSSSLVILKMANGALVEGDKATLIKRSQFSKKEG